MSDDKDTKPSDTEVKDPVAADTSSKSDDKEEKKNQNHHARKKKQLQLLSSLLIVQNVNVNQLIIGNLKQMKLQHMLH